MQEKETVLSRGIQLVGAQTARAPVARQSVSTVTVAWVMAAFFYFYQYSLRSSPSVMMPQLSQVFGLSTLDLASLVALFYYGSSLFSLVAGAAMDQLGPRRVMPIAAAVAGAGALLFATGNAQLAALGRLAQGAGGVFALVGAIYIASKSFSPSRAATLVGATQMFGMAGGAAGQFIVGLLMARGVSWNRFWAGMGSAGFAMGAILLLALPREEEHPEETTATLASTVSAFYAVFKNPQSMLCGAIAGLLFFPTTIFDMIWGVRYLQDAHGLDYASAVMRSATVPLGWIIGCPLLGFISDRLGRRKPVLIGAATILLGCLSCILFGRADAFPRYLLGVTTGIASGSAMLLYTVIMEANPPQFGGTATGVVNFLNFSFSALLGPVFTWMLHRASGATGQMGLIHFQVAFAPLLLGVAVAIVLSSMLKETGPAACQPI
jgi:MFS family permease